ncbi:MAG: hypothetical protein ABI316_04235 [Casimicrobiaceae bacterium]
MIIAPIRALAGRFERIARPPFLEPTALAPLDYMKKGGTPAMQTFRRLLDARRGGL